MPGPGLGAEDTRGRTGRIPTVTELGVGLHKDPSRVTQGPPPDPCPNAQPSAFATHTVLGYSSHGSASPVLKFPL